MIFTPPKGLFYTTLYHSGSNFCNLLLKTADSIMVKAFVAACSSKHKTPLLGKRYDKLASKKSKKNSEPLITSAFAAENHKLVLSWLEPTTLR